MSLSGADFIIQYCANHQIKFAFLVPGYYIDPLLKSLIDNDIIKPIICNSELGSGYIADGYARGSKNIALCLSTAGGAVTNLTTAVFNAKEDEISLLVITGNTQNNLINSGGFQAIKSQGIFSNFVKYSAEIKTPETLNQQLNNAIYALKSHPLKPVHLSIPLDIQNHYYESSPVIPAIESQLINKESKISDSTVDKIGEILNKYSKISVLVGQRLKQDDSSLVLLQFAEKFNLPVATTLAGKGAFPETHPLSLGTFSLSGHLRAKRTLLQDHIEVLLLIGKELQSIPLFPISQVNNPIENNPIPLNLLIQELQAKFPPQTILCVDAGFCRRFAASNWLVTEIDNFYSATNLAPMGWAIGAGIGIKLAKPEHPIIVLTGDGSMTMHGLDIITAIRYQLPIFYVVSNNQGYGTIYQRVQNQTSLAKQMLLPPVNWVNFAQSLGINAVKLQHLSELETIIQEFFNFNSPFLLEVDTNLTY